MIDVKAPPVICLGCKVKAGMCLRSGARERGRRQGPGGHRRPRSVTVFSGPGAQPQEVTQENDVHSCEFEKDRAGVLNSAG